MRRLLCLLPHTRTSTYVRMFLEDQSRKFEPRKFYADVPSGFFRKIYTPENFLLYGIPVAISLICFSPIIHGNYVAIGVRGAIVSRPRFEMLIE